MVSYATLWKALERNLGVSSERRREPPVGGIIVARASSEQELQEILSRDPLQHMGLVEYEVFPFEAAEFPKRSSAFETFAAMSLGELTPVQETDA